MCITMTNNKKIKKLNKYIDKLIKDTPDQYNQTQLLTKLTDDSIDHYMSLSNRGDGKTFSYFKAFLKISIKFDIKIFFIVRKFTLRNAIMDIIEGIFYETDDLNSSQLFFRKSDDYVTVIYQEKEIAVISDINNAIDLKQYSTFLKNFPILLYDEFIASKGEYSFEEWKSLQFIYSTVDRGEDRIYSDYFSHPKIFYLGNTENFDSPIISNLQLFNILENHEINTMTQYDNVLLEMRLNESANEKTNSRAFKDDNHAHKTGEFKTNNYQVKDVNMIAYEDRQLVYIKLVDSYIEIDFSIKHQIFLLSIVHECESYDFNTRMSDNTDTSIYLDASFYKDNFYKKYENEIFKFKNYFSKVYILDEYINLNLFKCIKLKMTNDEVDNEKIRQVNEKDILLKKLSKRFEG